MYLSNTGIRATHAAIAALCVVAAAASHAGPREQAKRIHDRLAGVPPSAAVLDRCRRRSRPATRSAPRRQAMQNPAFYNTTVRELATPWTNRDRSVYAELNDSTATVIGMVRDDVPFDQVLYGDIVYVGSDSRDARWSTRRPTTTHYLELQQQPRRPQQHGQPRARRRSRACPARRSAPPRRPAS